MKNRIILYNMNIDEFISSEKIIDLNNLKMCNFGNEMKNEYNFITESSKNIENSLINYAEKIIDRGNNIIEINKYINNLKIAVEIENGIFEYALVHITVNNYEQMIVFAVYTDKIREICRNLDPSSHLQNKTLKENVLNGSLTPRIIAFLSPEQLHPEKWTDVIKKRQYRLDKEQNMATTDLYQCKKCKERKCIVTRAQIRSLDEATTTVIHCSICSHLWMI
jgi:DNA-directed RNA polymerase subunit M/transcription elongation factor TFIIS